GSGVLYGGGERALRRPEGEGLATVAEVVRVRLVTRVLLSLLALFAVATAGAAALSAWAMERALQGGDRSQGEGIAGTIAEGSVEILLYRDPATLQAMVDQYAETEGVAYIYVVDADGDVVAHTFVPGIPPEVRELSHESGEVRRVRVGDLGDCLDLPAPIL